MTLHPRPLIPVVLLVALLAVSSLVSAAAVKLFLKDGSYQLVSSYEVHGDRVRYYSLDRSQWEEIPASLVDFEATKRAEGEEKAAHKQELEQAKKLEAERFERTPNTGLEVAPGIRLPEGPGIYTLDGLRIVRLIQSPGEVVKDKKRMALLLALPAPVLKSRAYVVLAGEKAAVRLPAGQPTFYVQLPDNAGARMELMGVKSGKDSRLVEKVEQRAGIGKASEVRAGVQLEREEIAPGLFKLKPTQALGPGEYALGELTQEKLNLDVWDFGIDKPGATP